VMNLAWPAPAPCMIARQDSIIGSAVGRSQRRSTAAKSLAVHARTTTAVKAGAIGWKFGKSPKKFGAASRNAKAAQ